ncbi:Armadillo/beta-catenin-like repeat protein [Opisthorchis viverrini]|uniref:Armadillo/beta-catenin-like repeat protein n=1 Tax=Opisthorchis viverrini TaxID=6198 RepID=A0A1S8WL58_OPIVI|nr:Armadillo/beta-catenin-like repeat protein [Opisthorchis viverrini]
MTERTSSESFLPLIEQVPPNKPSASQMPSTSIKYGLLTGSNDKDFLKTLRTTRTTVELPKDYFDSRAHGFSSNYRKDYTTEKKHTTINALCKSRYTDFITKERLRAREKRKLNQNELVPSNLNVPSLVDVCEGKEDGEEEDDDGVFAKEMDDELQRRDFEEFIILNSLSSVQMNHIYFKIVKLFRYIRIVNPQGTVIALLSLNSFIKRAPEVVQAVEESDGIVVLLNLLESQVNPVQLASMKLLSNLFQIMYLRRVAIAFGAVQILVNLLLDSDDRVKAVAANLLASLAILKEARLIIPKTKGIQHLICLLDLSAPHQVEPDDNERGKEKQNKANRSGSSEKLVTSGNDEDQETCNKESVLVSVATALWRLSRSAVNRKLMQRAGLTLILMRLLFTKNSRILVPLLGIIQGCAPDVAFCLSFRTEAVLKCLADHLKSDDIRVKIHCCRILYYCLTEQHFNKLGVLVGLLKAHTKETVRLLQSGWVESDPGTLTVLIRSEERHSYTQGNNNAAIHRESHRTSMTPNSEVRTLRLRVPESTPVGHKSGPGAIPVNNVLEDGQMFFQLLYTILATLGKAATFSSKLTELSKLGTAAPLIELVKIISPYLLTYRQPSCAISPRLHRVAQLERVCGLTTTCLANLATCSGTQKLLLADCSVVNSLVQLLSHFSPDILVPTIDCVSSMVSDSHLMLRLNDQGTFRLLFSYCFGANVSVCNAALNSVQQFLKHAPSRGTVLRSVNSSLGLTVKALSEVYRSLIQPSVNPEPHIETHLSAICGVLAEIASDNQGRAILIELGAVPYLINITTVAKENCLRTQVCAAITQFAQTTPVLQIFHEKEFIRSLIEFVRQGDLNLQLSAVRALERLSFDPNICSTIRVADTTSTFLRIMCDAPEELQSAAAHLIGRIAQQSLGSKVRYEN